MSDFFYRNYQKKTNSQLEAIVNDEASFQPEAVNAARRILNERGGADIHPIPIPKLHRKGFFDIIFDIELFRKTVGFKDLLTWITLALVSMALMQILNYYADEPSIENNTIWITISVFLLVMLSNHIIFKATHGCSNNVIGRILHDMAFLFMLLSLQKLYSYIIYESAMIETNNVIAILLIVLIFSFVFEFMVAILKRFLSTLFKWEVL